ncbi:MAG: hypothetical protein ACI32N_09945, partial [Bulleidia sp.]
IKGLGKKITDFKSAFNLKPQNLARTISKVWSNSVKNLKGDFLDFSDLKAGCESLKNILSFGKDLVDMKIEGKINVQDLISDIVAPAIGFVDVPNKEGEHKMITLDDFSSKIEKIKKLGEMKNSLSETTIDLSCLKILQDRSSIDISVKPVNVPQFSI